MPESAQMRAALEDLSRRIEAILQRTGVEDPPEARHSVADQLHDLALRLDRVRGAAWPSDPDGDRCERQEDGELRRTAEYYRALIENAHEVVAVLDRAGRIRYASPAASRELGYRPERLLGRQAFPLVRSGARAKAREAFARAIELEGQPVEVELTLRCCSGETKVLATVITSLLEEPAVGGIVINTRDVTAKRDAEEELRMSEERYRLMVESSDQVFFYMHDLNGVFQYLSRSVEHVHGWTPEELVGRDYSVLVDPASLDHVHGMTDQALLAGERMPPYTAISRHKDGRPIHVEIVESPLVREGRVIGMHGFARDVSDRVHAEERAKRAEERLRQVQKLDAVGRLAGGIAHDFNNILTAISGNSLLLLEEPGLPDIVYEGLREIDDAAGRAASLTRHLLAFSRNQVLRPQALDLNGVIGGMERMLRRVIGEQVVMRTTLSPGLPPVLADAGQMEQVLMNLVVNSRDAMPEGGQITIETRHTTYAETGAPQAGSLQPGTPSVLMSVSDTGHGMDAATLERIFEPFFTTRAPGRGTGLGLPMVYGIVTQTGGAIHVDSTPGRGTSFRIYLPPAPPAASGPGADVRADHAHEPRRILVVEDERAVRQLMERVLTRAGYRVRVAEDPVQALHWAGSAAERVDLLLTDMVMPRMSGRALAERFATQNPLTRILFVSGYAEDGGVEVPGGILQKPFSPEQLLARVREVLGEQDTPAGEREGL